jgi:hypothetical protein
MLRAYLDADPELPRRLAEFAAFASFAPEPSLLGRLHNASLLPERYRRMAIHRMAYLAVTCLDIAWLDDEPWEVLLTNDDRLRLFAEVRNILVPRLRDAVNDDRTRDVIWKGERGGYDRNPMEHALYLYRQAFAELNETDAAEAFANAIELNRQRNGSPSSSISSDDLYSPDSAPLPSVEESPRSIFADIEEGE